MKTITFLSEYLKRLYNIITDYVCFRNLMLYFDCYMHIYFVDS